MVGAEKLRREIDQAHSAMFEPSPSVGSKRPHSDAYANTTSPSKVKRSKTAGTRESPSMHTSGEKNRLKRTYSRKPNRESPEGDIFEFRGDDELPVTASSKPKKVGSKPSQLDVAVPLLDVYQVAAQTVNPLDTLNQQPVDPSPLHSSAFLSPTNASDPYSHAFGTPSQQLPAMGPGFEEHEPNVMFPEMSSTIAASSSSLEKRMTPQTMKTATPVHRSYSNNVSEEVVRNQEHMRMTEPSIDSPKQVDDHTQPSTAGSERKHIDTPLQEPPLENVRQQQKKRKIDAESEGPDLSSEAWVGLPKENYKPRPSRSRSALPSQVEPLASLESSSSNRSKSIRRSRTGGSAVGGMSNETTQKLIEMGFTAADSEAALIGNDWVFERALETLIARGASRSRSPEVVKSKAQVTEAHEVVKETVARNEGTVVIFTSPMRGDAGQGVSPINGSEHGEISKQADDPKEVDKTKDSTNDNPEGLIVQDQADEAQAAELAPSPSNTKIKRTKSTKSGTKPKKNATAAEADQSAAKQLNAASTNRTESPFPPSSKEQNEDKLATIQQPAQDDDQMAQENSDLLKPEKKDTPALAPKDESNHIPNLPQHKPPQAGTNEVIELDDDSDDGPPVASKKLRRTKTAPAAALKKEKKKKGKKGKSKQSEQQPISEEKVVEDDADEPMNETREALQKVDGNAVPASVVNDVDNPTDEALEDVVPAKSKKADTKATKKVKSATPAKSAKTIHDSDDDEETQAKPTDDDKISSEPAKPSKSANKKMAETQDGHDQTTANKETTPPMEKDSKKKEMKKPHSPIKRVTYRVGLSKRTRIEPLLKMRR